MPVASGRAISDSVNFGLGQGDQEDICLILWGLMTGWPNLCYSLRLQESIAAQPNSHIERLQIASCYLYHIACSSFRIIIARLKYKSIYTYRVYTYGTLYTTRDHVCQYSSKKPFFLPLVLQKALWHLSLGYITFTSSRGSDNSCYEVHCFILAQTVATSCSSPTSCFVIRLRFVKKESYLS